MSAEREGLDLIEKVQEQRRRQGWNNGAKVRVRPWASAASVTALAYLLKAYARGPARYTPYN